MALKADKAAKVQGKQEHNKAQSTPEEAAQDTKKETAIEKRAKSAAKTKAGPKPSKRQKIAAATPPNKAALAATAAPENPAAAAPKAAAPAAAAAAAPEVLRVDEFGQAADDQLVDSVRPFCDPSRDASCMTRLWLQSKIGLNIYWTRSGVGVKVRKEPRAKWAEVKQFDCGPFALCVKLATLWASVSAVSLKSGSSNALPTVALLALGGEARGPLLVECGWPGCVPQN